MKYFYPLESWITTQLFGGNANTYYKDEGLKGHPAIDGTTPDWDSFGKPILAATGATVYKVINRNNPDLSKYRAVFTLHRDGDRLVELVYGHLKDIYVQPGDVLLPLQPIGTCGNTGVVYAKGIEVTTAQKLAGSHAGAHSHFQKRYCHAVASIDLSKKYLSGTPDDSQPYRDSTRFFYEIDDYANGFNGCADPLSEMARPSLSEKFSCWAALIKAYGLRMKKVA